MHFLQSSIWQKTKESIGNKTYQFNGGWFQITKLPFGLKIGYVPRINRDQIDIDDLFQKAKNAGCVFLTIETNENTENWSVFDYKKNFPKYSFSQGEEVQLKKTVLIDLEKTEDEIFAEINKKNRYYIRTAQKAGTQVLVDDKDESFEEFLKLYLDTKSRQSFFGRGEGYLRSVWKIAKESEKTNSKNFIKVVRAIYGDSLHAACLLFTFEDTVYYPYAGTIPVVSSKINPNYSFIWEIIRWSKQNGFKNFDFYGIDDDETHGFTLFKKKFGGRVVEYETPVDLIINKNLYKVLKLAMNIREKVPFIKNFF